MEPYSVLMSVYGKERAEYLRESIESMLSQTERADDFVIVCDGPLTDELEQALKEAAEKNKSMFQIIRLKENQGLGIALNQGIRFCRNELIARMDSDDISVAERCEKQLAVFASQNADIVGGIIEEFADTVLNPTAMRKVPQTDKEIKVFAKRRNPFNHPSVMFRKSAVERAGNYEDCKGFEDYYLWTKMLKQGMVGYNIQETLVYMRTSAGMYKRRGSFSYAVYAIRARWKIYKLGYSRFSDFFISSGGQLVMSLAPLKLRGCFYRKLLRK